MPLFETPLHEISESDLQALVDGEVAEGLQLEFKLKEPGNSDADKREFLADISSFANASGGDILFGIREDKGKAKELVGLTVGPDSEILRLTSIARTGLDPLIPSLEARAIPLKGGSSVVILRARRSWLLPHMVTFKGFSRFFARGPAGKHQLNVTELRSLFSLGGEMERRVRDFRSSRLATVVGGETPVLLQGRERLVLHLVPLSAFGLSSSHDVRSLESNVTQIPPLYTSGSDWRHNLDGFVTTAARVDETSSGYVQVFRNGAVEAVETSMLGPDDRGKYIPSVIFERELIGKVPLYLAAQRGIGVSTPIVAMLSLLNVKGFYMAVNPPRYWRTGSRVVDRRDIIAPEVLIEDFNEPIQPLIKKLVDPIWNAAGWAQSVNFGEDGTWQPK